MATETPEQRRLRLQHTNAGNGFERAPLPRPIVEELPMQNQDLGQIDSGRRLNRGESGLGDVTQDSRARIRTNAQYRGQPSQGDFFTDRPSQERMGLSERSQEALKRAERFTSAPGTITQSPLQAQVKPKAVGGVLAAGLGASTTALNAASVYDQTGGDWAETAKQVAYDVPAAVGSTLGAVAGGVLGRRSPTVATTGMLAGGALGDTGGNQIASGVDRLLGGDGMSPLQALQAQNQQTQPRDFYTGDVPLPPGQYQDEAGVIRDSAGAPVDNGARPMFTTGAPPGDLGRPAPVAAEPQPSVQAAVAEDVQPAAAAPAPAAATVQAPQQSGFGQTGIDGIVGRTNEQGVTEFSNRGDDVRGASGTFNAGGRLGDGQGTFSTYNGQEALARFERANQIRGAAGLGQNDFQSRQQRAATRATQLIERNSSRINDLMATGDPADRRAAAALQAQNEQLAASIATATEAESGVMLGQLNASVERERTAASQSGLRDYLALAREQALQTKNQAAGREDIAARNAETYERDVTNTFAVRDPQTGEASVPPERLAMITQRAPEFAKQREAAMRESIMALQQQAKAGDPTAQAQLEQAKQDYKRFRQDIYRIGSDGKTVELRPVDEWNPTDRKVFFDDIQAQERLQAGRTDSIVPDVLGGIVGGALTGLRAPGSPRARLISAAAGAGLGAIGADAVEKQALGTRSTAAQGANNASPLLAANYNSVTTEGDNIVATLNDGSVVNLSDLVRLDADPSITRRGNDLLPSYGRGGRTSQYAPVIQTTFDAAAARLNSPDEATRRQAQDVLAQFARDDALYQSLTPQQRARLPRNKGLGE